MFITFRQMTQNETHINFSTLEMKNSKLHKVTDSPQVKNASLKQVKI